MNGGALEKFCVKRQFKDCTIQRVGLPEEMSYRIVSYRILSYPIQTSHGVPLITDTWPIKQTVLKGR